MEGPLVEKSIQLPLDDVVMPFFFSFFFFARNLTKLMDDTHNSNNFRWKTLWMVFNLNYFSVELRTPALFLKIWLEFSVKDHLTCINLIPSFNHFKAATCTNILKVTGS